MQVHVAKVNGILFSDTVDELTVPTATGVLTLLPNHMPLVTVLNKGRLVARKDGQDIFTHEVERGVVEVTGESVTILI